MKVGGVGIWREVCTFMTGALVVMMLAIVLSEFVRRDDCFE